MFFLNFEGAKKRFFSHFLHASSPFCLSSEKGISESGFTPSKQCSSNTSGLEQKGHTVAISSPLTVSVAPQLSQRTVLSPASAHLCSSSSEKSLSVTFVSAAISTSLPQWSHTIFCAEGSYRIFAPQPAHLNASASPSEILSAPSKASAASLFFIVQPPRRPSRTAA